MARKQTREELETALRNAHVNEQASFLFLKHLKETKQAPKEGWYFVASARGYSAFLILVQDNGGIVHYASDGGSEERKHSRANLYRCEEDGARRTSFLRAVDAENRWISKFQAT